jgi:glycerophosphoryl diester phosphodiesterase
MAGQGERLAAYDGRVSELDLGLPSTLMPLVSNAWHELFQWRGVGPMPAEERRKLHALVQRAHLAGRQIRFWETPEAEETRNAVWSELRAAGVDYINTDSLAAGQEFLSSAKLPATDKH